MAKRRRGSYKSQQSKKRLRKTEDVPSPLVANERSITPKTKNKNEGVAPKVRIGPNLILTGPTRSTTDAVEEIDGGSTTLEIPYGRECSDTEPKPTDHPLPQKNGQNSKGYVRIYRRPQNRRGREVMDSVVVGPVEVVPATLRGQLRQVKEKLDVAKQRISQLEVSLDEKSKMLNAASSFMNVTEPLSGADIINLANIFNNEVFQGAAYIAESLASTRRRNRRHQKSTVQFKDEYKQALMSLGADLLRDLMEEGEDDSGEFFLLRVALQVCMVTFGANVLRSWSPDDDEHRVTDQIYRRILSKESQGVAGSWRSVTRRSQVTVEPMHRKEKIDALLYTVIDIVTVAGCWGREDDPSAFFTKFQGNIARVVDSTLKLWDAIGNVTHMDILPMTVPPDSRFCHEVMANDYATATTASESDTVLATTELGLEQKVNSLEGDTLRAVLLKPKIVLHSALLPFFESEQEN